MAGNEGSRLKVSFAYCRRSSIRIRIRSDISQIVRTSSGDAKSAFLRFVVRELNLLTVDRVYLRFARVYLILIVSSYVRAYRVHGVISFEF